MSAPKPKVVAIVGPTASGKTSLSIALAHHFNGEVISADSRQIYRGLDIGTGKVTKKEMSGIPHHLLDIADPTDTYTATDFVRDASTAILDIKTRHRLPIIAGGTFFYLDLLRGKIQAAAVPPNPTLRAHLESLDTPSLSQLLHEKDPIRSASIDHHNRRRLIRSLEIIDYAGTVPPVQQKESPFEWLLIGIETKKDTLQENFGRRIDQWLAAGFLAEVQKLQANGLSPNRLQEIGFEYTLALRLINNTISEAEFRQRFIEKNWQYAKRQLLWLKRDPTITWYAAKDHDAIFSKVAHFLN